MSRDLYLLEEIDNFDKIESINHLAKEALARRG